MKLKELLNREEVIDLLNTFKYQFFRRRENLYWYTGKNSSEWNIHLKMVSPPTGCDVEVKYNGKIVFSNKLFVPIEIIKPLMTQADDKHSEYVGRVKKSAMESIRKLKEAVKQGKQVDITRTSTYEDVRRFVGRNFRRIKYPKSKTMKVTDVRLKVTNTTLMNSDQGSRISQTKLQFKGSNQWYDQDEVEILNRGK